MKKNLIIFIFSILAVLGAFVFVLNIESKDDSAIKSAEVLNLNLTEKDPLIIDDFQMGGVKLEQPISSIETIFGKPKKIYDWEKGKTKYYEYDHFKVRYSVITGKILTIIAEKPGFKTLRGIAVGDNENDVFYRYGKIEKLEDNNLNYQKYISRDYLDYTYALDFTIQNDKVSKIMIYFAAN